MKRSDLICENGVINDKDSSEIVHKFTLYRTKCTEITIDKAMSDILKKPEGRYITIFCNNGDYGKCFEKILVDLMPKGKALVAGLGNESICSDSLGAKALRYIPATAHLSGIKEFSELGLREIFVIGTSVTGKTGFESTEQIKCIAESVNADFVIAIDCLACSETERLCRTIQITDGGIALGAGVGNNRKELNRRTIGKDVIAIGVPTVIDFDGSSSLMVTPRNIDVIIDEFSEIIGRGISRSLNTSLSAEELNSLIIR